MFKKRLVFGLMAAGLALIVSAAASAQFPGQEVVVNGPPPALRKNLDAFQEAFNSGDAAQYEAMAKATFTAEYLKKETADERKKAYTKWRASFGTVKFQQVERRGPEAPLEIFFKGSVASGVMWMELDEASKIAGIKAEGEKK